MVKTLMESKVVQCFYPSSETILRGRWWSKLSNDTKTLNTFCKEKKMYAPDQISREDVSCPNSFLDLSSLHCPNGTNTTYEHLSIPSESVKITFCPGAMRQQHPGCKPLLLVLDYGYYCAQHAWKCFMRINFTFHDMASSERQL